MTHSRAKVEIKLTQYKFLREKKKMIYHRIFKQREVVMKMIHGNQMINQINNKIIIDMVRITQKFLSKKAINLILFLKQAYPCRILTRHQL